MIKEFDKRMYKEKENIVKRKINMKYLSKWNIKDEKGLRKEGVKKGGKKIR